MRTGILCSSSLLKSKYGVISDHLNLIFKGLIIFPLLIANISMVQAQVWLDYWKRNLTVEISDPLYCHLGYWLGQLLILVKFFPQIHFF